MGATRPASVKEMGKEMSFNLSKVSVYILLTDAGRVAPISVSVLCMILCHPSIMASTRSITQRKH